MAAGVAARFGIDPNLARAGFVLGSIAGGAGLVAYMLGWVLLPLAGPAATADASAPGDAGDGRGDAVLRDSVLRRAAGSKRAMSEAAAAGVIVLVAALLPRRLGLGLLGGLSWPLAIAAAGITLIWRVADEDDRAVLERAARHLPDAPPGRRRRWLLAGRIVAGIALILAGTTTLVAFGPAAAAVRDGVIATVGVVLGVALIFGPWWLGLARDLAAERRERIRADERAELASRVHDSVLQTLALIQRRADDPRAVVALARRQERELRDRLYGPATRHAGTMQRAIEAAAREVEEVHGVPVEVVAVGDAPLDDGLSAAVAAAREAMVNAAIWSGADRIAVYAEVEARRASVFVRDRGCGFDPDAIGPGHEGIARSIVDRIRRHGGRAVIRSRPGDGTEVELVVERAA